jgi:hypothetical protein
MRRQLRITLSYAIAITALLCGLLASPALAKHDHDDWHHGSHNRHHNWSGGRTYYYRDYPRYYSYGRSYYYEPREYYEPPTVYVPPPPPPSFGLNLVFPIH